MAYRGKKRKRRAPLCKGYTQEGKRCQRPTRDSSGYCHDHLRIHYKFGKSYTVKVKEIIDGDTFKIESDVVRLTELNTPEKGEPGYRQAKDDLESLIPPGTKVEVSPKAKDPYGRLIGDVKKKEKKVSESMKEEGWDKKKKKDQDT